MSVPDSGTLDLPGKLSFEAWIRLDSLPKSGRFGILDNEGQYSLILTAELGLRCSAGGGNAFSAVVNAGEWVHIACVHDGTDVSIWVDGSLVDTAPSGGSVAVLNSQPMSLADTSPAFNEPMDGLLGGVRVWNVARSAQEIAEAAAAGR